MNQSISIFFFAALLVSTEIGVALGSLPVVAYVDSIKTWWGCDVPAGIGLPKQATNGPNVIALSFWLTTGPADAAALWANLPNYIPTDCGYGTTNAQMQQALIQKYHSYGMKVIVSAFGSTDFPTSKDPTQVCYNLSQFVLNNSLDGVDLDFEDTGAFQKGTGASWLINCTKVLRQYLPQGKYIVTHAPQGPYFTTAKTYPDGAYLTIDSQVGQLIDWYNLQYYNQGTNVYTTYQDLFVSCSAFPGTAVLELKNLKSKIAVGKPANASDVNNGWVSASTLAGWLQQANQAGWCGGAMYWQLTSDTNGTFGAAMNSALSSFTNCAGVSPTNTTATTSTTPTTSSTTNTPTSTTTTSTTTTTPTSTKTTTSTTTTTTPTSTKSTTTTTTTPTSTKTTTSTTTTTTPTSTKTTTSTSTTTTTTPSSTTSSTTATTTTPTTTTPTSTSTTTSTSTSTSTSSPPVVSYIDAVSSWWGCDVPAGLGLTSKPSTGPNVVALSFWTTTGPADAVALWANLPTYIPSSCGYGSSTAEMQQNLIQKFHNNGVKVIVSAFGSTDYPTSKDPTQVCYNLSQFVLNNNLDGVDLDYEDTGAFQNGVGASWLINCTKVLRQYLPQGKYILTHAPQGPYFTTAKTYPDGAYLTIDSQVGQLIDWYNLQYYNQGDNVYTTYQDLFVSCSAFPGTAVLELKNLKSKVAVGKPVTTSDASNGWVSASTLAGWLQQANQAGWCGGAMYWQGPTDTNGTFGIAMRNAVSSFTGCSIFF